MNNFNNSNTSNTSTTAVVNSSNYLDQKSVFVGPQVTQHGSHMIMTNVVKEIKTKYLSLDTKFGQNYQDLSLASCSFSLPEKITGIQSISVSSVHLPLTFYNISKQLQNNSFQLHFNNEVITICLPDGFYTLANVLSVMKRLLGNYNILFELSTDFKNRGSCILTFTPSSSIKTIKICFNTDDSGNLNKFDLKSRLGWILGFRLPHYILNSTNNTINSEGMTNLYTLKYIFLVLDEYSSSSHSSSFHSFLPNSLLNKNILAQISIDSQLPWGSYQNCTIHNGLLVTDTRQFTGDRVDLQKCQVQLVNEFGRVISLNYDFSFVLELKGV